MSEVCTDNSKDQGAGDRDQSFEAAVSVVRCFVEQQLKQLWLYQSAQEYEKTRSGTNDLSPKTPPS